MNEEEEDGRDSEMDYQEKSRHCAGDFKAKLHSH